MVRELAVTARIGVGYKIVTNLVMLPVAVVRHSTERSPKEPCWNASGVRAGSGTGPRSEPRNAVIVVFVTPLFWRLPLGRAASRGRHVAGWLPELRPTVAKPRRVRHRDNYDVGLDWLSVVRRRCRPRTALAWLSALRAGPGLDATERAG